MGGLISYIYKLLAGSDDKDQKPNANSMKPIGMSGMSNDFKKGIISGSSNRGELDTSESDHALGMSALKNYRDMSDAYSQPNMGPAMNYLSVLQSLQGRPNQQPMSQRQVIDPYVAILMSRLRGR